MTIKPFAIQGSDLTLGGVNLQAGATTIVIPGVTEATNYRVEEVNETDVEQTFSNFPAESEVVVIDKALYDTIVGNGNVSTFADFTATTNDDGEIDEIQVNGRGTYSAANADRAGLNDMYAYIGAGSASDRPLVPEDWIQIPFRPKMRANAVESIGGGSGGVVERSIEFPAGAEGDTAGTLALTPGGNLYICKTDWVDYSDAGGAYGGLETYEEFLPGQTGSVSNVATILLADVPSELLYILQNVNINASDWSVIMDDEEFGGEQTCTDVAFDVNGNIGFFWPYRNGTDPNGIPDGSGVTVAYSGEVPQPAIWQQINLGNPLGDLTIEFGNEITNDSGDIYLVADDDIRLDATDEISIRTSGTGSGNYVEIVTGYDTNNDDEHKWKFDTDGNLTLPAGGDILDSNGDSVLGGTTGDANIWVQDFETTTGAPADVVGMASSVEYLANGDIVALFVHYVQGDGESRYSSVARFTSTGTKQWSMSFQGSQYTDGWGLAVDNDNSFIYVAGRSDNNDGYDKATLTKLAQDTGAIVWSKYYDVGYDNTNAVVDVATDGNPVVVGYADNGTDTQIVTSKISSVDGSIIWSKTLNGQGYDEAYGMAVGPSGEVVTVGYMDKVGIYNAAETLYTEPASNPNWTSGVGGPVDGVNFSVTFTDGVPTFTNVSDTLGNRTVDGVVGVIGGNAFGGANPADNMTVKVATLVANDENNRILIAKYAANGTIAWQKAVTVDAGFDCNGADADIDGDGNIYVCGNFSTDNQSPWLTAMIIIKFNSSGVKQWTRKVQGDCEDYAASIVVGPDNCLYLSAVTASDGNSDYSMVIAKYTIDGLVAWQRLLDNTTTWTFSGGNFFGPGGSGSTIAVRTGYVAVVGGFGDPGNTIPHAILAQFDSEGTVFPAGDYDFKAASFSGLLNGSASNIIVFDADKTASDYSNAFDVFDFDPDYDLTSNLVGTLYSNVGSDADLIGDGAANKTGYKYTVYTDSANYQGGEESGVILKDNPDHPYTVGDLITFRNGEQKSITSVQTGFSDTWVQWSGPVGGSDENPRFPITVQSSNYAPETKPTARIKPDLSEAVAHDHYMKIYAGNPYPGPIPTDPGTPTLVDSLHIHMAGGQENVELFLGTDANYVSTKEAGDTPAGVRLHSEVDVSVVDTNLRLDRKGSTWVSVYGDGENKNLYNNSYDLSWSTIAVDDHGDYYVGGEDNQYANAIINKYSRDGQLLWSKYNNGDDYNGWQVDGVAYHNNQVATLVQTDNGRDYNYYKLSVLDSSTGDLISTTDIHDPDGNLEAHSMIHHSTLGWTVVGNTRGEVATTAAITDTNNPYDYDAIRLLAANCLLDGVLPANGNGWNITGTNIGAGGQNLNSGIGYFANRPVTAVTGTGVDATANVYIDYNNGTYDMDYVSSAGSGYAVGDTVKILGSQLGGVDGNTTLNLATGSFLPGSQVTLYMSKADYPTLYAQLTKGVWTADLGSQAVNVVSVTNPPGEYVNVVIDTATEPTGTVAFNNGNGNDMTFTCDSDGGLTGYYNYAGTPSLEYIFIDMNVAGGYVDTAFKGGTFTLTRQRDNRPWIWTNEWTRFLNPTPIPNSPNAGGQAYCVAEDPLTHDLVVGGYIDTFDNSGTFVWKLNDAGVTQWAKTIDGDDNDVSGIAVSGLDSSIYVATNYTYVHKLSSDSTMIRTVGTFGPWGVGRPEIKLAIEEDGFEYVYVGGDGGGEWTNNSGFFLSKLTTDLATVWGRSMWSTEDNFNKDYDIEHTTFVLGKGQASIVGFGYPYSLNNTTALIYTISTRDQFEPVDVLGWQAEQRGSHTWVTEASGLSMYNIITAGATASTATALTETQTDSLSWTNYAFQSKLINLNTAKRGIVGVETIEFTDGGTLDHNPADIPPSVLFDPSNSGWEYTLQLSDRGRFILNQTIPNDSNCQDLYVYVPRNDQVAFPVGTVITLINASSAEAGGQNIYVRPINFADGDGWVRIWATGGGQNSSQWRFQGIQTATLMKISTNAWLLTANNIINDD